MRNDRGTGEKVYLTLKKTKAKYGMSIFVRKESIHCHEVRNESSKLHRQKCYSIMHLYVQSGGSPTAKRRRYVRRRRSPTEKKLKSLSEYIFRVKTYCEYGVQKYDHIDIGLPGARAELIYGSAF